MTETLLSTSNVLLFGRRVQDLAVRFQPSGASNARVATRRNINTNNLQTIDGIALAAGDFVLVRRQQNVALNDVYLVAVGNWTAQNVVDGTIVRVTEGDSFEGTTWIFKILPNRNFFLYPHGGRALGANSHLGQQLDSPDASFARIYGFSHEGTYYDLPEPALFLVHGDGDDPVGPLGATTAVRVARAPLPPSVTGVGAADFQLAEEIRVWSYDKADYTIRLDVQTGMFEQVLLDIFFGGGGGGPGVSGARVSGARVSGARVSGARVSGARLSGGSSD